MADGFDKLFAIDDKQEKPVETGVNPKQAATIIDLQSRTQLPRNAIINNEQKVRDSVEKSEFDVDSFRNDFPSLSQWTDQKPDNFSLIKNNLDTYQDMETMINGMSELWRTGSTGEFKKLSFVDAATSGFRAGQGTMRQGQTWYDIKTGKRDIDDPDVAYYDNQVRANERWGRGFTAKWLYPAGQFAASIFEGTKAALPYAMGGAMGAGTAGLMAGPAAPVVAPTAFAGGFTVGAISGYSMFSYEVESGMAYQEMVKIPGVTNMQATVGANTVGLFAAALETVGVGKFAKPYMARAKSWLTNKSADLLKKPTVRQALAKMSRNYVSTVTTETGTEVAQEVVSIMGEEILRSMSTEDLDTWTDDRMEQMFMQVIEVAASTARGMSLLAIPGAGVQLNTSLREVNRAKAAEQFFRTAGKGLSGADGHKNLPASTVEILKKMTEDGPVSDTWFDIGEWNSYWQDKGADPREIWEQSGGDIAEYDDAGPSGVAPLSTADSVSKLAAGGHTEFVANEGRMGSPESHNGREIDEWMRTEPEAEADIAPDSSTQVLEDVRGQLLAAGQTQATADTYAQLYQAAFQSLAERTGQDAKELFDQFALKIQTPGQDLITNVDDLDVMLDRVRGGDIPTEQDIRGLPLSEFIRQQGGVLDEGGELAAMDLDILNRKGARNIVRDIEKEPDAPTLATVAERAAAAGYIPSIDENLLLDALREELADTGARGFAPVNIDEALGDKAVQLEQLADLLDAMGLDIDNMSNKEIKDAMNEARTLYKDDVLGAYTRIGGRSIISLFEGKDFSTFLHESGHFFLEVLGDVAEQNETVAADYQAILDWFGVKSRADIKRDHHEKFARGFELYLREGKAPTEELRSAFDKIRTLLLTIYRQVTELNVRINKDVREVLDRLLATDEAIEAENNRSNYRPIFADAASANMTEEQFSAYQKVMSEANAEAKEILQQKALSEMQRENRAWWKAERKKVRDQVEAEINQSPAYVAFYNLTSGTLPDGTEVNQIKLDKSLIIASMGKEFIKKLPRGKQAVYGDNGMSPDMAAIQLGFKSGDELLYALANMQKRSELVKAEVESRMTDKYGDMLNDGSLAVEAEAAVNGKGREKVIEAELRALRRAAAAARPAVRAERDTWQKGLRTLREQSIPIAAIREIAKGRVDQATVGDLRPGRHLSLVRKYSREAAKAAVTGDFLLAQQHKQNERLHLEMYKETIAARKGVERTLGYLRKFMGKKVRDRLGKTGHLEQIDNLLERIELRIVPLTTLQKRESLRSYLDRMEKAGLEANMPDEVINELFKRNWKELTVYELQAFREGAAQIEKFSRLKNKLLKIRKEKELRAIESEIVESLEKNAIKVREDVIGEGKADKRKQFFKRLFAGGRKFAGVMRQLDGLKDGGYMWETFVQPLNEAATVANQMHQVATEKLSKLLDSYGKKMRDKVLIDGVQRPGRGGVWTREELLAAALNMGNEDSRAKFMAGHNFNENQMQSIIEQLDDADWDFVESVWEFINSYWEETKALEERQTGTAPDKVEAASFVLSSGREIAGGYYPLAYDSQLSQKAERHKIDDESGILRRGGGTTRKSTRRGHTKARVEGVRQPVRLSMNVMFDHVGEVIHDLSHRETLLDVNRLLIRPKIAEAMRKYMGREQWLDMMTLLGQVADNSDQAGATQLQKIADAVGRNLSFATLGYSLSTMAIQPVGIIQSAMRLSVRNILHGIRVSTANPRRAYNDMIEKSPFMKDRSITMIREINEIRNRVAGGTRVEKYMALAFSGVAKMQLTVDMPTWYGSYQKSIEEGFNEKRAIDIADNTVRETQSSGILVDRAGWQRGPGSKLFTAFYTFFSSTYELTQQSFAQFRGTDGISRYFKLMEDMLKLYTLPVLAEQALTGLLKDEDDDDQDWKEKFLRMQLSYIVNTIPIVREISGALQGYRYRGPMAFNTINEVIKVASDVADGDVDAATTKALVRASGAVLPVPSAQVNRTIDAVIYAWDNEEFDPRWLVKGAPRD